MRPPFFQNRSLPGRGREAPRRRDCDSPEESPGWWAVALYAVLGGTNWVCPADLAIIENQSGESEQYYTFQDSARNSPSKSAQRTFLLRHTFGMCSFFDPG